MFRTTIRVAILNTEHQPTQDEVLRRLGRNLLLFQQIEHFLKWLLANHKGGGTAETYQANQQEQTDCINKKMLGLLVEKYGNELLQDAGAEVSEEDRPAGWFSFSFRVSGDTEFVESMRQNLKLMTDERNELVHHFLPRWQPESPEKIAETLAYLDAQREKVLPMFEHLKSTATHMQETRRLHLNFMASPEFEKQSELLWLQASPLVDLLREVTSQYHREDGWTYLGHAGNLAAKEMPEELGSLKKNYGFRTLKKLLVGCEIFDVFDEPLPNGNFKTLYKNKEIN
jgi:hypothetical protein